MSLLDEIKKGSPAFMNTIHLRRTSFFTRHRNPGTW